MTPDSPAAARSSIQAPIAPSQGHRSPSVSGIPAAILATLAAGWKESPSAKAQPSRAASSAPIVDFPLPDTPATTTIIAGSPYRSCLPAVALGALLSRHVSAVETAYLEDLYAEHLKPGQQPVQRRLIGQLAVHQGFRRFHRGGQVLEVVQRLRREDSGDADLVRGRCHLSSLITALGGLRNGLGRQGLAGPVRRPEGGTQRAGGRLWRVSQRPASG